MINHMVGWESGIKANRMLRGSSHLEAQIQNSHLEAQIQSSHLEAQIQNKSVLLPPYMHTLYLYCIVYICL